VSECGLRRFIAALRDGHLSPFFRVGAQEKLEPYIKRRAGAGQPVAADAGHATRDPAARLPEALAWAYTVASGDNLHVQEKSVRQAELFGKRLPGRLKAGWQWRNGG
jgi:hypothetical protein